MIHWNKVVSWVALLTLANAGSSSADDGTFKHVSPFAVHVSVDGSTRDDELERALTKSCLSMLRASKVPTAQAEPLPQETKPFFHWEFWVRPAEDGKLSCLARVSVKLRTRNPLNNTVMDGLLASGFKVQFLRDSETPLQVFSDFMKENTDGIARMWRRDNPLTASALSD